MKPLPIRVAREAARQKGFEQGENDHEYWWFILDGRKTSLRIKLSHGARELKPSEIRKNAFAWSMPPPDFFKVLSCDHDHDWMTKYAREKGSKA